MLVWNFVARLKVSRAGWFFAGSPTPVESEGQTAFGAFPWQAALLTLDNLYIGSGVLIDNSRVLTAAHKLENVP